MVSSPSRFAALAVFLTVLPVSALLAMHEANHRYDVAGYILSADDQAISGVTVAGHVDGKPMGSGRSDTDGYYRFTMHLHDTDVGRELRLKTADYQGTVRLTMTPRDTRTLRLHHVNFIAGKLVEGELPGRGARRAARHAGVHHGDALLAGDLGDFEGRLRQYRAVDEEDSAFAHSSQ